MNGARPVRAQRIAGWLAGPLLAAGALILYSRTMAQSLGGTIDSPEFQQATYSLSIVHPTGYPLYLLLGRLWITLFPFRDPAFRVNLLSAIFGALAVWVLYATVAHITGSVFAGAASAALFAVQAIPWAEAGVAEINTLNTLLTGAAFLAFILWASGKLPLPVAALAYGLAASHHRTAVLYAPLLALFVLAALKWGTPSKPAVRGWLLAGALFLVPFLAYLYIPLRGNTTLWYSNTWQGFWREVLGESALPVIGGALQRPLIPRFAYLFRQIFTGWPGLVLAALGAIGVLSSVLSTWSAREREADRKRLFRAALPLLYAAAFVVGLGFSAVYDILDITDYLAVPIFMLCVLAGVGISALQAMAPVSSRRLSLPGWTPVLASSVLAVLLLALLGVTAYRSLNRPDEQVDFSHLDRQAFWSTVKASSGTLPQGARLIGDWPEVNEGLYMQRVEGWRPDLHIDVVDDLVANKMMQVDQWLSAGIPMYVLGQQQAILSNYDTAREGPFWKVTSKATARPTPQMQHVLNRRYGDNITLLGYTLNPDPATLAPGDLLEVTLFWKTDARLNDRYVVFNHVIDAQGGKIGQKDDEPGRGSQPTIYWQPGQVVADTFPVAIDPGAPPGDYRLMTGLYTRLGEQRLPAYSADGKPLGDYPELATVSVK